MDFYIVIKIWKRNEINITPFCWYVVPDHSIVCDYYTGKEPVILDRVDRGLSEYSSDDALRTMHRYYLQEHTFRWLCLELKISWWHKSAWHNFPAGYHSNDKKLVKTSKPAYNV